MIGDPTAIRIRKNITRPTAALVRKFAGAQTSFIADAQQGWNCLHHSIKGLNPKQRFVGTAITASGGPRDNLAAMVMLDVIKQGDVLVISTGWDESGAVVGDHWAAVAKHKGAVGVVTDGLVRDAAGIEKLGPPTFSRGLSPNAGLPQRARRGEWHGQHRRHQRVTWGHHRGRPGWCCRGAPGSRQGNRGIPGRDHEDREADRKAGEGGQASTVLGPGGLCGAWD